MSTIQQLKNFIRHGKQAKAANEDSTRSRHEHSPTNQHQAAATKMASTEPDVGHSSTRQHGQEARHADDTKAKNIARLVAEENANRSKFPKYPGLERWELVEKMGDGAFSNVYRARDREGNAGEVAIKVVRKYEMNSMQVHGSIPWH